MYLVIIEFLKKIITNPKVKAFVIIGATQLIKKVMENEQVVEKIKNSQPLHLPRGSVRAILTLILTFIVAGSFIWRYEIPTGFYELALIAIGYYVGYRTDNSQLKEIKS
jgi:uncharacterized membrane protein AbrB (regulator of aidB expression)